ENGFAVSDDAHGKDVPTVLVEDIRDQEINFVRCVANLETVYGPYTIVTSCWRHAPDGFDLDSPENSLGTDDNVVSFAFAPRLGNGESKTCGLAHESELCELTAIFVVEFGCVLKFVFDGLF